VETSIANLSSKSQNIATAISQITDADIAEESAKLAANTILQQSATAVLGLANRQPGLILQLLSDS
jgi:flagellin